MPPAAALSAAHIGGGFGARDIGRQSFANHSPEGRDQGEPDRQVHDDAHRYNHIRVLFVRLLRGVLNRANDV
jgi:hypothetical protein